MYQIAIYQSYLRDWGKKGGGQIETARKKTPIANRTTRTCTTHRHFDFGDIFMPFPLTTTRWIDGWREGFGNYQLVVCIWPQLKSSKISVDLFSGHEVDCTCLFLERLDVNNVNV